MSTRWKKEVWRPVPTYEYCCNECGATLERWQRFSDSPLTECPSCSGSLRRVYHAAGIIFKGSGWYSTDSRPRPKSESEGDGGASKSRAAEAAA